MADFERILRRLYNGLILRDVVGYAVPGFVSLGLIQFALGEQLSGIMPSPSGAEGNLPGWAGLGLLIMFGFVWGWVLHAVLFGALRLLNRVLQRLAKRSLWKAADDAAEPMPQDISASTRAELEADLNLIGTLSGDAARAPITGVSRLDRLEALTALSGNLATALALGIPLMAARLFNLLTAAGGILSKIGLVLVVVFILAAVTLIALALYAEFWRLWKARNLLAAAYAAQVKKAR